MCRGCRSEEDLSPEGTAVRDHGNVVAVHSGRSGQQLMLQVALGHVLKLPGGDIRKAGIVLDKSENVRAVDRAGAGALGLCDHDSYALLEQRVRAVRLNFLDGIGVVLHALDDQLARCGGYKLRGVRFVLHMVGHIPHALGGVERAGEESIVRVVVADKFDLGEIPAPVRKLLGHVDAVNIHMAVVHQRVVVIGVAAFPGEDNLVVVAAVAVGHTAVAVELRLVGDAR